MPDPAPTGRESSKGVSVGEPPTPEGWTIYVCGNCRSSEIQESNENDSLCADCGEWMNVEEVRVAPVGGAGVRLRNARIVAEYWRDSFMDGRRDTMWAAHPLAMVLGALDGETEPAQMGIPDDEYERRAASVGEGDE